MPERNEWNRLINNKWPANMPKPTAQEAVAGAKRLYKRGLGRPWTGKVKVTSGRRDTWIRRGTLYVNPEQGWPEIVHLLSHWCHYRKHPGDRPHSYRALEMEKDLTNYVLANGFHEGRLRRETKPKVKPDPKVVRYKRAQAALKRWQTKAKRAETAIRKYRATVRRYEKVLGEERLAVN